MYKPEKHHFEKFEKKVWLASPTMYPESMKYAMEAYETNWMSTVGENINELEKIAAKKAEVNYAVALSNCTAALHLCIKDAGEKLYGRPAISHGALEGKRVFCSDMTFDATLNLWFMKEEFRYLLIQIVRHGIWIHRHWRRLSKCIQR